MTEEIKEEVKKERKEDGTYVFPKKLAKAMLQISPRTQMEASMLSMVFILAGIIVFAVLYITGGGGTTWMKIMAGVNALAAFVMLGSYIVTTFQQYHSYLKAQGVINVDIERESIEDKFQKEKDCKEVKEDG